MLLRGDLTRDRAEELFDLIVKFAGYGFNKSHSAAYAMITFYTSFLKTYYPTEFMSAILTLEKHNTDKVVKYVDELKRLNIELRPPDVNFSDLNFQADSVNGDDVVGNFFGEIGGPILKGGSLGRNCLGQFKGFLNYFHKEGKGIKVGLGKGSYRNFRRNFGSFKEGLELGTKKGFKPKEGVNLEGFFLISKGLGKAIF